MKGGAGITGLICPGSVFLGVAFQDWCKINCNLFDCLNNGLGVALHTRDHLLVGTAPVNGHCCPSQCASITPGTCRTTNLTVQLVFHSRKVSPRCTLKSATVSWSQTPNSMMSSTPGIPAGPMASLVTLPPPCVARTVCAASLVAPRMSVTEVGLSRIIVRISPARL